MKTIRWLFALLTVVVVSPGSLGASEASPITRPPNIVFILADDLGWTDTGVYGSRYYETPNIDRLAAQGMRLMQYHNAPNCQPTRAALMTGQYGPRTGVYTVGSIDRFNWRSRPLRPVDNVERLPLDQSDRCSGAQGCWIRDRSVREVAPRAAGRLSSWEARIRRSHREHGRAFQLSGRSRQSRCRPASTWPTGSPTRRSISSDAIAMARSFSICRILPFIRRTTPSRN